MTKEVALRCGAIALERLLEGEDGSSLGRQCACGGTFVDKKHNRPKALRTVLGEVTLRRRSQRCNRCGRWRVAEDEVLDVVRTGFSPGLRRMMAKTGAERCFDKASAQILELAGVSVTDKDVERVSEMIGEDVAQWEQHRVNAALNGEPVDAVEAPPTLYIASDGTGVPVLRRETEGRCGKAKDGIARSREAKLGAVFTQSIVDEEGKPVRDPRSTTYVGKIESSESFGARLYAEALRRGFSEEGRVAFLGDGALWLWNIAGTHFPGAQQIVDYYHATEHLSAVAHTLYPDAEEQRTSWLEKEKKTLWEGQINSLIKNLRSFRLRGARGKLVEKEIGYFEKNAHRMRYDVFRQMGLFIGSGVVEAGCKSLIGGRLKQSGMHWTVRGANAIIALRCCIESGTFEDYWESRRAA